tara:strand:+ start:897 stop:1181 length:285 start_codon:yes stop_codon:yes gene_type:complete
VQNFLISENTIRKSAQLADDLALIRQREADPEAFAALQETSTSTSGFDKRIQQSIDDINALRERYGITQPRGNNLITLEELLSPRKGSVLNHLS